jgi:hypothetical protein
MRVGRILAAVTVALVGSVAAVAPASGGSAERSVTYRGYTVRVPASWPVVDLAAAPHTCVRFDRPAVYLGRPGDEPWCPTDLVGRTAGLLIEPLDGRTPVSGDGTIQLAIHDAGVLVTAAHNRETESAARAILASATLDKDARPADARPADARPAAARPTDAPAPLAAAGPQPGTFTGRGFDTCTAPSQSTMNAWRTSSPYRAIGVYISGASRSCAQPNLTATWVTNQTNNGWRLIPIELDHQAPCGTRTPKMSADPTTARSQGASRATSAVTAAQALGIPPGSAIYNDIEHYPSNASCRAAVLSYLSGWTQRLHALGYLSGMYSSGSSGVLDLCNAYNDTRYTRVDHLFFGWWNGVADTDAGSYCPDAYYADHQRIHQYTGDTYETWGGVRVYIDRDYLDVSAGTSEPPPTGFTVTVDNTTAGGFTASANWGTSTYSAQRIGPDYRFASPVSSSDVAWWRANLPATGAYDVSVYYPAAAGYNDSTPYIVSTTSGNQTVRVNQRLNGGQWLSLGVFTLAGGDANKVGVSRWTTGTGYVIADAVRITRV